MGFLNLFFGRPRLAESRERIDPDFGAGVHEDGCWTFLADGPANGLIVVVEGSVDGPGPAQRRIFRKLLADLCVLEAKARQRILSDAGAGATLPPLHAFALRIGDEELAARDEFHLELTDSQSLVLHRIRFVEGVPVDCLMED
jgi:hypothetical protein